MPEFTYKAKRASGEVVQGTLDVADRATALRHIDRLRLVPMAVDVVGAKPKAKPATIARTLPRVARGKKMKKPKLQDLANFSRQLANLIKSGMTLNAALGSMTSLEMGGVPTEVVKRLQEEVLEGKTLSSAMAAYPDIFSDMYVNMVRAGEQSGSMEPVLRRLADHYKRFAELRHKVTSAMIYPAFVMGVGVIMVLFFMFFMMPKFEEIFEGMAGPGGRAVEWPLATKIVMDISKTLVKPWVMITLAVLTMVTVVLVRRYMATDAGRRSWDAWLLRAPLLKGIVQPNLFGQFASTLGALLQNGVPVLTALRITQQVVPNMVLKEAIKATHDGVTDGKTIAQPLARATMDGKVDGKKVFPQLMIDMIHIGEQTGDVPGALNNVAETYENELSEKLRVMTTLIEPVLIVVIAVFVGFLLFSVLSAMFKITSSIGR
ncbi:MAG: type II secretion system F family protein [Pedosphaera sp.]|nr:type II secretion system F family protein [Pedosphaera sp.]MSU43451.1 type II secretion system F family protein [Pedosphaera sp.]